MKSGELIWERMTSAFKILSVSRAKESKYLTHYYISEKSLRENFEKLFNFPCDILARIMYIKLSKRKDCAKINFLQFADAVTGLLDEVKDRRNRTIFNLMEFNGDGELDIMILMQLFNNISRDTQFGQEIIKVVREYKNKNVLLKGGFSRQITLNFATFNQLIPYSALIDEFQYRIFGVYIPEKREKVIETMKQAFADSLPNQNSTNTYRTGSDLDFAQSSIQQNLDPKDYKSKLIVDRDKGLKLPPPIRNCFEIIPGLEVILAQEELEEKKKKSAFADEGKDSKLDREALSDPMMTNEQYQKLFDKQVYNGADIMLLKLR